MRKLTLSLIAGAAVLATGGIAYAQAAPAPQQGMARAAVQQRADQMFDRLDANHDGKLDQADREARQKARFDRVDTNHDGQVSYAEFTAMHTRLDQTRNDRAGGRRGERFGRGGDHRMAMHGFGRGLAGRAGLFRSADADSDGAVSKAEFEAAALRRFDRIDTDHNGTVTPDEVKAARDSMRQQWQSRREARDS